MGVGEHDPGRHCDDLDAALFHSAVSAGGGGVCGRNVFPGQGLELDQRIGLRYACPQ
jgi:hypothetical protein